MLLTHISADGVEFLAEAALSYHCVFYVYRHFPEILKSHSSHDVVLLCAACHKKSGVFDQQYKLHFANLCNAPYKSGGFAVDGDLRRVKSAARYSVNIYWVFQDFYSAYFTCKI